MILQAARSRAGVAFVSCVVALVEATSLASTVQLSGSQVGTSGGPFTATVTNGSVGKYSAGQTFDTFCVEIGEHFSPGTNYWAVTSDRARQGTNGTNGTTDSLGPYDLLNPETAYLYTIYMNGTIASVIPGWNADLVHSKRALQAEIWKYEGELESPITQYGGNLPISDVMRVALRDAATAAGWTGIGSVRVMQLWTSQAALENFDPNHPAGLVQDQLVLVPTPTASAAGASLLGTSCLVGWYRRRRLVQA